MTNLNDVYLANPVAELAAADLLYLLDDPGGIPTHGAIRKDDLFAQIYNGGWIETSEAWTYASATTINVPTDATARFQKGWGIRFKQGGTYKYMYMTTVAAALLTVTGGSDYIVANAAITDVAVTPNPQGAFGFPLWFNTASLTVDVTTMDNGAGGQPTTVTSKFMIVGKTITHKILITGTKAGTSKLVTFTNPSTMPAHTEGNFVSLGGSAYISGIDYLAIVITKTSTTRIVLSADSISDNQSLSSGISARYSYDF